MRGSRRRRIAALAPFLERRRSLEVRRDGLACATEDNARARLLLTGSESRGRSSVVAILVSDVTEGSDAGSHRGSSARRAFQEAHLWPALSSPHGHHAVATPLSPAAPSSRPS